ncbi:AAEL013688-PA [Aedes aegypti]|uniref:WD repeat-containing protein 89 n=2 Tax=Aedes aegypti TaxID=7159 RepID=A0A1S4FZR5_AEDAE|nr:WD repeat-containing protein 89 [Aedes aegypti]EAT34049.1 AAEL013688-PA [Aedes aegypti]
MFEDPQSSDEESPVPDSDSCKPKELNRLFEHRIEASSELAASLKRTCGLHLALSNDGRKLAVGLSRKELQLYDLGTDGNLVLSEGSFTKYGSTIRGVRFFEGDPNALMVCTEEGDVSWYDLRSGCKPVHVFEDTSEGPKKTMTAFDINRNDRVLCASTEVQKGGDSFLLFFDIRERSFLGSYWECHSEDITNVRFHPTNPDLLSSGSVDGLINVFDISQPTEDDAMQTCFNVEDAIESINWHTSPTDQDWISCITTTNNFHLYDVESQDMVVEFDRQRITDAMKRSSSIDCNVVNTHNDGSGGFFLLAGSNYNKGECLRSLKYDNKHLLPHRNFLHNRQIIRASVYNEKEHCLITTGESGLIAVWRCETSTDQPPSSEHDVSASKNLKQKLHISHRSKPY